MSAEMLQKAGLRVTSPRLRVLRFFEQYPEKHFTADDIIQEIIAADEHFAAATVYRVLSQLVDAKLILRHQFDDHCAVYEFNKGDHHDHMICLRCGKVLEFTDPVIESLQAEVAKGFEFQLMEHCLNIYGLCQECSMVEKSEA